MVSDYLFCGTCFLNFRLCDINLFIEHKKNNCGIPGSGPRSPPESLNSTADALFANLLECVQCFRRFSTAWPLLMHVQFEHQMLFANAFKRQEQYQQKPLQDPTSSPLADSGDNENTLDNAIVPQKPSGIESDMRIPSTTQREQPSSVETQTVISSFRSPMRYRRKRVYPSCCTSLQTSVDETTQGFVCTAASVSGCSNPEICCPPSTVVCNCQCLYASPSQSTSCPACVSSSQSALECVSCEQSKPVENSVAMKTSPCCLPLTCPTTLSSEKRTSDRSQRAITSCCPCSPKSTKPIMASTEAQTDFELEFTGPDYEDIAMLLSSPFKSDITSPVQPDQSASESMPDLKGYTQIDTPTSPRMTNLSFEGNTPSVLPTREPTKTNQSLGNSSSVVSSASYQPVDSSINTAITFSAANLPVTMIGRDSRIVASSCLAQTPVSTQSLITTPLISGLQIETNRPQFTCDHCGRAYRQKVHLRKHILIQHVGKKPFECPLCTYTTVEKSHLTVHIRTHTGERPFRCRVCDYSSSQNCTLKAHYMRKHSDNCLYCAKCSERFFTEQELHKHERQCFSEKKMTN
ncbi:zinc finger, C2H2 type [Opisthorchis viverrini]|uniref:Zinc finger, C2H2 type n=2 Tax=Opisthorchis viverrini TaxID=6198 RepID=A0A1S8WI06_OPIVI|nr:zinc finger, C2H2 type [Opisthorchis viverrini]